MKKLIMATVIAACIALCAAVWPQNKVVEENRPTLNTRRVRPRNDCCGTQYES